MSKAKKAPRIYLVERAAYRTWAFTGLPHYEASEADEGESYVPLKAFTDRADAEADQTRREAEVRATLPPALFVGYSIPSADKELTRRLKALQLPPLPSGKKNEDLSEKFRKWWVEHGADLTPEQRSALWELFPNVVVYRVTETTLEE